MKYFLSEGQIPGRWFNTVPYLPRPLDPPIDPQTGQPVSPDKLLAIFPKPIVEQEVSDREWIDIPEEVLRIYSLWRPIPHTPHPRRQVYRCSLSGLAGFNPVPLRGYL